MNETHDPALRSWVESANSTSTDFPVQNLPFGVFRPSGGDAPGRVGVAIGDQILDMTRAVGEGLFDGAAAEAAEACKHPFLNALMVLGPPHWSALRRRASELLRNGGPADGGSRKRVEKCLVGMRDVEMLLPACIGNYTDFYASVFHAANVGRMFRPEAPLLPNYKYVPIAYHGRASSIVVSGTPVRRPLGQTKGDDADTPSFGPTRLLDYELEVGVFVGRGNALGEPIPVESASDHIFGLCLVNDWSARDIQKWEYQPLGPFLGKNFATTVSPWVVTVEALEPYRVPAYERPAGDPAPLPHLQSRADQERGGIDMTVEVYLRTPRVRDASVEPVRVSRGNLKDMYWTVAQMVAHHTSGGCNLQPGDLVASGTVSGPDAGSRGCLLELTERGSEPLALPGGERRAFLEDGDEVVIRGFCEAPNFARIGLGECRGVVTPAPA
jgi:fumarylacetoacetase